MERLKHEPSLDPPEVQLPRCPECGAETDTFLMDSHGTIVGCPDCIDYTDAWDWVED